MGDANLERARRLDAQFRTMDFDKIPNGQMIDERSMLHAAADPNAIPMEEMKRIHDQNEQMKHRIVTQTWTNLSNTLPDLEQKNTPPRSVQIPNLEPVRTNKVFQTYKDIAHDLTHFKDLPQKTNLQKLKTCFFDNGRSYVSVTSFLAFCIIMMIVIVIIIGARNA